MKIRSLTCVPSTPEHPRNGEGSAVLLKNGKILLVFARFTGAEDHARGELYGGILNPETGELSECRVFHENPEALNQMSVSLERLQDGSIGMVYILKLTANQDRLLFSRSTDEGETWSAPRCISDKIPADYFVVNNDRLRQFSSGRLAVPVCVYPHGTGEQTVPSWITLLYSDDNGENWSFSNPATPCMDAALPEFAPAGFELWDEIVNSVYREMEPGVEELADGKILLYCRTRLGYMHYSFSGSNGTAWSAFRPAKELITPSAPQSIRRLPGSNRLICLYNDRRGIPFCSAEQHWDWRTPLTLAVSDDNGASWKNLAEICHDGYNWCYASILFAGDTVVITVYRSENEADKRRNLANLQLITLRKQDLL